MTSLHSKKLVIGVTGSIAAYKAADLIRRLREAGALIQVVMSAAAKQFISPLTLQALSENPINDTFLEATTEATMSHIHLARANDCIVIAPATAHFMAKIATGQADDLLSTLCLACETPLVLIPAMNQAMWANPATQENLATLQRRGHLVMLPDSGLQACGETGLGRMPDSAAILAFLQSVFTPKSLAGVNVVITAGPTQEAIDTVRFISNHSSGKMGFALAQTAHLQGANVTLISGPCCLPTPYGVKRIDVVSAQSMLDAVLQQRADLFIANAAVADYRPVTPAITKIKKTAERLTIELVRNPDIVATVCQRSHRPYCVGFAAETDNLIAYAQEKLHRKGCDMIAANDVSNHQGFYQDENALWVITRDNTVALPKASKTILAQQLIALIAEDFARVHRL